jgi:hypothetical protein
MCGATTHVCFGPKADMCGATAHVCSGVKADMQHFALTKRKKPRCIARGSNQRETEILFVVREIIICKVGVISIKLQVVDRH